MLTDTTHKHQQLHCEQIRFYRHADNGELFSSVFMHTEVYRSLSVHMFVCECGLHNDSHASNCSASEHLKSLGLFAAGSVGECVTRTQRVFMMNRSV